mmetsp:Transcript_36122/g.93821  ORF Transcript_36122/g.93821 Transcript_36122/m.93821 type:complete len:222 (-) Transcript_36122:736-1401(-)
MASILRGELRLQLSGGRAEVDGDARHGALLRGRAKGELVVLQVVWKLHFFGAVFQRGTVVKLAALVVQRPRCWGQGGQVVDGGCLRASGAAANLHLVNDVTLCVNVLPVQCAPVHCEECRATGCLRPALSVRQRGALVAAAAAHPNYHMNCPPAISHASVAAVVIIVAAAAIVILPFLLVLKTAPDASAVHHAVGRRLAAPGIPLPAVLAATPVAVSWNSL